MAQEYKDYVSANGAIESQATPTTNYVSPGVLTTNSSVLISTAVPAAATEGTTQFPHAASRAGTVAASQSRPGSKLVV